jgi:hypothetical protein
MIEVRNTYFAHTLPYSLSLGGLDAPMSDTKRAQLCAALAPDYCKESAAEAVVTQVRASQRGRGCEVAWNGIGAALVRCNARDALSAARMLENTRSQAAALSQGRQYTQPPPAPCTNEDGLESSTNTETFADHTGAQWQVRASPVQGCDWVVVSMSRTLPDGTMTLVRGAPSAYADAATMQLKALTSVRRQGEPTRDGEIKDAVLAEVGGANEVSR